MDSVRSSFGAACLLVRVSLQFLFFFFFWFGLVTVAISISFSYYSVWRCRRMSPDSHAMLCVNVRETRHAWGWTSTLADDITTPFRLFFFPRNFRSTDSRLRRRLNAVTCHSTPFSYFECFDARASGRLTVVWSNSRNQSNVHQTFLIPNFTSAHCQSSVRLFIIFGCERATATSRPRTYWISAEGKCKCCGKKSIFEIMISHIYLSIYSHSYTRHRAIEYSQYSDNVIYV